MRKRIYQIIEASNNHDKFCNIYDCIMLVFIVISLIPLAFKSEPFIFRITDVICVCIFIIDYVLRWLTADYKFGKHTAVSFIRYPFSPMAIIDLISILPSFAILNNGLKMLRLLRMIRALKVFRVFKTFRYSKNIRAISNVFKREKKPLIAVCSLAIAYILITSLVVFNVEPTSFNNFFDAIYWSTVSLTTVGYGDIYPITTAGRIVTMVSSVFGIAIIALPAGILTAGYMTEISNTENDDEL